MSRPLTTGLRPDLWPDGPECPRCGQLDRATKLKGKSTRIGVYKCKDCRKPFTVKVGTIFEDSHIPMRQVAAGHCVALRQQEGHQLGASCTECWG